MIDWKLAQATASTLAGHGPDLAPDEAAEVVEELRAAALTAREPVRSFTGLTAVDSQALVVDRPHWVEANLATFELLAQPVFAKLARAGKAPGPVSRAIGAKVGGAELGAAMAFLSTRVLGQFDPFTAQDAGRLLLVAPNIAKVGTDLDVDAHDFRLWVCLHEETHRAQFTGVPWMRDHLRSLVGEIVEATDVGSSTVTTLVQNAGEVAKIVRGTSDVTLAELLQGEAAGPILDKITGLMSLLEGHADVVMDDVGPQVVPSVDDIRAKFERRRSGSGPGGAWLRVVQRVLGMDAKLRQYRDGAKFVREVTDTAGPDGFAAVWAEAANLPDRSEILDPPAWLRRVHG